MKSLFVLAMCVFSLQSFAESKFTVCMDAGIAAGMGYDIKQEGGRLPKLTAKNLDMVHAAILRKSMEIGYKARTHEQAVREAHDQCVKSPLWTK